MTYDRKLLMFRHTQHPEAGIQVPVGTIKLGEEPVAAAIRELAEESGLADAAVEFGEMLGTFEFDMLPYRDEFQERFVFHVRLIEAPRQRWIHYETHDGVGEPTEFEYYWRELDGTDLGLAGGQGLLLPKLYDLLTK